MKRSHYCCQLKHFNNLSSYKMGGGECTLVRNILVFVLKQHLEKTNTFATKHLVCFGLSKYSKQTFSPFSEDSCTKYLNCKWREAHFWYKAMYLTFPIHELEMMFYMHVCMFCTLVVFVSFKCWFPIYMYYHANAVSTEECSCCYHISLSDISHHTTNTYLLQYIKNVCHHGTARNVLRWQMASNYVE